MKGYEKSHLFQQMTNEKCFDRAFRVHYILYMNKNQCRKDNNHEKEN